MMAIFVILSYHNVLLRTHKYQSINHQIYKAPLQQLLMAPCKMFYKKCVLICFTIIKKYENTNNTLLLCLNTNAYNLVNNSCNGGHKKLELE